MAGEPPPRPSMAAFISRESARRSALRLPIIYLYSPSAPVNAAQMPVHFSTPALTSSRRVTASSSGSKMQRLPSVSGSAADLRASISRRSLVISALLASLSRI